MLHEGAIQAFPWFGSGLKFEVLSTWRVEVRQLWRCAYNMYIYIERERERLVQNQERLVQNKACTAMLSVCLFTYMSMGRERERCGSWFKVTLLSLPFLGIDVHHNPRPQAWKGNLRNSSSSCAKQCSELGL